VAAARSEHRQDTYSRAHDETQRIHDRMADHGLQFSVSLIQMSEDLTELANNVERGRKQWKQTGLNAEKKVQDAEAQVEKAKAKYDSLADQYDRVRTGDKQAGKFGLKGHKSAAQLEEEVFRKLQTADSEYQARVQAARSARQELVSSLRPQTIRNLQSLIFECDSGLTLQLQKYGE
jgi:Rho GTPase-activating protein RGD1